VDQESDDNDPRNVRRLPSQARREKASTENLLHVCPLGGGFRLTDAHTPVKSMVREFLSQEGLYTPTSDLATGAVPRSAANTSAVAAYMSRLGQGPSQDHPLFSWEHPVSHAWNVAVIRVLNRKFRTYVTEKGLSKLIQLLGPAASTSIPVTGINRALDEAGDVEKLIRDKLEYQQALLRKAQRKIHSLQGRTELEVGDNLRGGLKTTRTKARRQERKKNVCSLELVTWCCLPLTELMFSYICAVLLSSTSNCVDRIPSCGNRSTSFLRTSPKTECPQMRLR
jgi:hypothetical protein